MADPRVPHQDWITKDGFVESISVDGDTDFSEYASYRPDVEVIITYHTFKKNQSDYPDYTAVD